MNGKEVYKDRERRKFERLNYVVPLAYKVCKQETISKLLQGYTSNISQAGLLCNIKNRVNEEDTLWLSFDKAMLDACKKLEQRSFVYQKGVIGRVIRVESKNDGTFDVGIRFVTREEKNSGSIYSDFSSLENRE